MTRMSVVSSWLCATGVVVVSSYCILTHFKNTPADQKKAAALVERINKRGTVSEAEYGKQRAELGKATDPARASEYSRTGINYFTVNPKVNAEVGKNGMVFR